MSDASTRRVAKKASKKKATPRVRTDGSKNTNGRKAHAKPAAGSRAVPVPRTRAAPTPPAGNLQPDITPDHVHQILDRRLLVPQKVAALAFGISPEALKKWRIKPREHSGRITWYYLPDLISLRVKRADSGEVKLAEQRARLAKLQGDKVELELQEKRGELVPAELILAAWEPIAGAIRAKVLALPAKIKRAAPDPDQHQLDEVIQQCRNMLEGLADGGIPRRTRKGN